MIQLTGMKHISKCLLCDFAHVIERPVILLQTVENVGREANKEHTRQRCLQAEDASAQAIVSSEQRLGSLGFRKGSITDIKFISSHK
jgi:hypothetical protein